MNFSQISCSHKMIGKKYIKFYKSVKIITVVIRVFVFAFVQIKITYP